jgi:DNA invertase Pin-like site-specific DNA recombinase
MAGGKGSQRHQLVWIDVSTTGRLERQREGIAKAKSEGRYKGRAPTAQRQAKIVLTIRAEGVTPTEIARRLKVSRSSVYRVLDATAAG